MTHVDTAALKSGIDLRYLARRFTDLTGSDAAREWYGPCPKCGGDDRFHVTADWFFCREGKGCHPDRGDAIEFIMWLKEIEFQAACEVLAPPAASQPVSPWPITITWPADAPVAAVGGHWQRLSDGRIRAVYHTIEELRWCLDLMQVAKEREEESRQMLEFTDF